METKQSRAVMLLLIVIATGVVVIAAALVGPLLGSGDAESPAHKKARHAATDEAEIYCTLGSNVTLDSPTYKNCVRRQVSEAMSTWESAH